MIQTFLLNVRADFILKNFNDDLKFLSRDMLQPENEKKSTNFYVSNSCNFFKNIINEHSCN